MMDLWKNRYFTPMLLGEVFKPFNSQDYIFEIKFDGTRTVIFANRKEVKIYNRRKEDITYLYPELQNIKNIVKNNTIFDGEIILMDNGVPSFSKLQLRSHLKNKEKIKYNSIYNPVIFICYDILYNNKNIINLPLIERKQILNKFADNDFFVKSAYVINYGISLFDFVKRNDLEGIVAKKINSLYSINKRSEDWLKIKNLKEEEFLIGGYLEKENSFVISLILGEYKENEFYYVGRVTLGKKTTLYKQLFKNKKTKSYFINHDESGVVYVKPSLKCKVKYMERTKNNHLRQPYLSDIN